MISLGQSLEEIAPKEEEPVAQQEEVALTVVPSTTSTAAESLASENSAATSAGSSQATVQLEPNPSRNLGHVTEPVGLGAVRDSLF